MSNCSMLSAEIVNVLTNLAQHDGSVNRKICEFLMSGI
jgi:hypothetical protein